METTKYVTIEAATDAKLVERKSTFLAFLVPVETVEQAEKQFKSYRKTYYDARHVCFAYVVGADGLTSRGYDNGEPSGTAGRPILGVLRSAGVTNAMILVVRYFGGIKLGTSGLIAAYKTAAELALAKAQVVERIVEKELSFTFSYQAMNAVMQVVKKFGLTILSSQMEAVCTYRLRIPQECFAQVEEQLGKIDGLRFE